jgi:hypothetical protein
MPTMGEERERREEEEREEKERTRDFNALLMHFSSCLQTRGD